MSVQRGREEEQARRNNLSKSLAWFRRPAAVQLDCTEREATGGGGQRTSAVDLAALGRSPGSAAEGPGGRGRSPERPRRVRCLHPPRSRSLSQPSVRLSLPVPAVARARSLRRPPGSLAVLGPSTCHLHREGTGIATIYGNPTLRGALEGILLKGREAGQDLFSLAHLPGPSQVRNTRDGRGEWLEGRKAKKTFSLVGTQIFWSGCFRRRFYRT